MSEFSDRSHGQLVSSVNCGGPESMASRAELLTSSAEIIGGVGEGVKCLLDNAEWEGKAADHDDLREMWSTQLGALTASCAKISNHLSYSLDSHQQNEEQIVLDLNRIASPEPQSLPAWAAEDVAM